MLPAALLLPIRKLLYPVLFLLLSASVVGAQNVALNGDYFLDEQAAILTEAGMTVQKNISLTAPITVDTLYLNRIVQLTEAEAANVRSYLDNGGTVVTEFSQTESWFNGKLAHFGGSLTEAMYAPSGNIEGANPVTVTGPTNFLTRKLPASWISSDPIGVFRVYSNLDPLIETPIKVLNTPRYGNLPVVGTTSVGKGTAVLFFTDFADFNTSLKPVKLEEQQLLINAMRGKKILVPAPDALFVYAGLGATGLTSLLRRRFLKRR